MPPKERPQEAKLDPGQTCKAGLRNFRSTAQMTQSNPVIALTSLPQGTAAPRAVFKAIWLKANILIAPA